jgi:ribonuclease PH
MLPGCSDKRVRRESKAGKISGRTAEIERLIGRSLRSVANLDILGERQIIIDCDVINADGGTRTASITGGYVALHLAISKLCGKGVLRKSPLVKQVAAVSCAIYNGEVILDPDYVEDSNAEVDANFVFGSDRKIIEVQACGENRSFSPEEFQKMLNLASESMSELFTLQDQAIASSIS